MDIRSNHSEVVDERQRSTITTPPVVGDAASAPVTNVAAPEGNAPVAAVPVDTAAVVGTETVLTSRTSGFTPSALIAGIVAIGLLVLGGITAARAGIDSSLDDPVVTVAGYTATALLGLIEIAFGLVLLIAAVAQARRVILVLGITGGVMALVAVFQPSVGEGSLAIEQGFAVIAAIVMGALVVTALLPTMRRKSVVQRTSDVI
jgi:uncharacterized membrane protein